jgi:hypothetical protein
VKDAFLTDVEGAVGEGIPGSDGFAAGGRRLKK